MMQNGRINVNRKYSTETGQIHKVVKISNTSEWWLILISNNSTTERTMHTSTLLHVCVCIA